MNLTLDSLLADWVSPRVRRLVHALLSLALLVVTAVLAANGDWKIALISLAGTFYAAMNKANTPATDLDPAGSGTDLDLGEITDGTTGEVYPLYSPGDTGSY